MTKESTGLLHGKRAVITDCNDFMGPAIAKRFAMEGAEVLADDRDLTQPGSCEALITEAGRVDILVVNLADPAEALPVQDIPDARWHQAFNRLVHPLHALVRAVTPQMLERGAGKIIVMGSTTALSALPDYAAYSAARGAQVSYVRTVGIELAPKGIALNLVAQNWVENPTYFTEEMQAHPRWEALVKSQVPVGRLGTGEEDAAFVTFLAGDDSGFFVGQIFPFAGGWKT
ncbi:MAG: SDR family oxidoreductase [Pseudomonadota bacterium]